MVKVAVIQIQSEENKLQCTLKQSIEATVLLYSGLNYSFFFMLSLRQLTPEHQS